MPKPYRAEFRRDVVAIARQNGSIARIAKGFATTESCLRTWLKKAERFTALLTSPNHPSLQ